MLAHSQINQDISIRLHLTPWQPSPPVRLDCTSVWNRGLSCWLAAHLILSIKAFCPHLMPCWKMLKDWSQLLCSLPGLSDATARTLHPVIITHIHHTQTIPYTCKDGQLHIHKLAIATRVLMQWQMIRCCNACCYGDSKARDPRGQCDIGWSILRFAIFFLYSYQFHKNSFIYCNKKHKAIWLHPLRSRERGV